MEVAFGELGYLHMILITNPTRLARVACILVLLWGSQAGDANAEDLMWALTYAGQDYHSQNFLYDPRIIKLISSTLGITPQSRSMLAFHGVPSPVIVTDGRYVWSSSCEAHECPFNQGFFWLDTLSGQALVVHAAISRQANDYHTEHRTLTIGSSVPTIGSVPPKAIHAMQNWIEDKSLHFDVVKYQWRSPDHTMHSVLLHAAEFSTPTK